MNSCFNSLASQFVLFAQLSRALLRVLAVAPPLDLNVSTLDTFCDIPSTDMRLRLHPSVGVDSHSAALSEVPLEPFDIPLEPFTQNSSHLQLTSVLKSSAVEFGADVLRVYRYKRTTNEGNRRPKPATGMHADLVKTKLTREEVKRRAMQ
jgi:hypothetical protein